MRGMVQYESNRSVCRMPDVILLQAKQNQSHLRLHGCHIHAYKLMLHNLEFFPLDALSGII